MVSFCSSSNDQLLTKRLIESSNHPLQCFHRFVNKSEWTNGLDVWSPSETLRKNHCNQRYLDFHHDIGLYLPRYENDNLQETSIENDLNYLRGIEKITLPKRLRTLMDKEKNLLKENHSNNSSPDDQLSSIEENQYSNSIQQSKSSDIPSNKVRLSLRQVQSKNSLRENQLKQIRQENYRSVNQEKIKSLLKQQITSLFCRESANINHKRTFIRIPLVEIKHKNFSPKTSSIIDSTLIMERYDKLQRLLISRTTSQATINNRLLNNRQSPLEYQKVSAFGLSVTPIDCFSSKNFENSSFEMKLEQENLSFTTPRLTQRVSLRYSTDRNEEDQRIVSKNTIQGGFISSSGDFVISNKTSIDEQAETIRKFYRHHRPSSNNRFELAKTSELLPKLVSGKRLHIPISNNRQ
ncbi:unnamed protein product [Rotaria socialis]|uniref:Uncharacterized protein n=1 Tax=Rotaria socialis TaxID=392032 RepID=A0A820LDZ5_9BILA|nr:unnamed protein product [Rotaria socialis]CAF4352714.1 unnamed protein product [Rotaria socialis]